MVWFIFLVLTVTFSLLTGVLGTQNLILLLVISFGINFLPVESFFFAFFTGLIFDLILGIRLGEESLKFLLVAFLIFLYKTKFKQEHFLFSFTFSFLIISLFNYLNYQNPLFIKSFFWAFLILPLNLGVKIIKEKIKKEISGNY